MKNNNRRNIYWKLNEVQIERKEKYLKKNQNQKKKY